MLQTLERACPLCSASDASTLFAESNIDEAQLNEFTFASRKLPEYMHHRILWCPTCDLLYASPVPAREALLEAYGAAAFDSATEAGYAARTYGRFLPAICRRLPDQQGALDIGTGNGAFLEVLTEQGFHGVTGVEPSLAPIAAAPDHIRPLIRQGFFRVEDFAQQRFSLVSCFQTMEHVGDPLALCRGAWSLLKPGGALFLIGHNRRAVTNRVMGEKSPIFDIEHLQLFSKKSAARMMELAGFSDVRVHSVVNRYPLHYWLKLFPIPSAKLKLGAIRWSKKLRVGHLSVAIAAGNMAIIGYRPNG